jgi:hypothetical protein
VVTLKKQFKKEEGLTNSKWAPEKVRGLIASLNKKLENKILSDIQKDIEALNNNSETKVSIQEEGIITDCLGILKTLELDPNPNLSENCFYQSLMKTIRMIELNQKDKVSLSSDLSTNLIQMINTINA